MIPTPKVPIIALYMTPTVMLSLVGALFIIISFILFKPYRNKSPLHSCICCMAICDFMMIITWWGPMVLPPMKASCYFQAYSLEFFAQGTMLWTSIFAIRLYIANMVEHAPRYESAISHILGWGTPLVLCISAGVFKLYGHAGAWCWIDDSHPLEQIFMGDGLSVFMFMIELTVFTSLLYQLRDVGVTNNSSMLLRSKRKIVFRFGLFLIIPPLCWGFGLTNRMLGYVRHEEIYWVQVMQAIFTTSQGFLNALIYGYDSELQALWISLFVKKFKIKVKPNNPKHETEPLMSKSLVGFPVGINEYQHVRIEVNVNDLYAEADSEYSRPSDTSKDTKK